MGLSSQLNSSSNHQDPLQETEQVGPVHGENEYFTPEMLLLREWQVRRLARTYSEMLANPRYQPSCEFFINDIYAARDFTQRNRDMMRLHDSLRLIAPDTMVRPLRMAIEMHELTEELDRQLLDVLVEQLGMKDALTVPMYAEAYRRCDNYDERARQIDMISELGTRVEALVNLPFSGTLMKLGRAPAEAADLGEVMGFLERGYRAFKLMHGAKYFLDLIHEREMRILDRIYASDPDPFGFGTSA